MLKTYKNWEGNMDDYLKIGDEVDEEFVNYFIDILSPRTMRGNLIQIGEPYDHINERATYSTIERVDGHWIYKGHCYAGHTENLKGYYEILIENM